MQRVILRAHADAFRAAIAALPEGMEQQRRERQRPLVFHRVIPLVLRCNLSGGIPHPSCTEH